MEINNTGTFPADEISINFNISNSKITKHLESRIRAPSICFPNGEISNLFFEEAQTKGKLVVDVGDKLEARIEISYQNKLTKKHHKTIRSYSVEYNPTARHEPIPLSEKDDWD